MERRNCWQLLKQFFYDNWEIELTDYACPTNWWSHGLNIFQDQALEEGFELLHCHPRDYRAGDVILCAIESPVGNHCAVFIDNHKILHHLVGQRSCVTSFGGMFRNNLLGVYRHKLVPAPVVEQRDIREFMPAHARHRLENLAGQTGPRG